VKKVRSYVMPGIMTFACGECKSALFVPVSLDGYAQISVFGDKVIYPLCSSCHGRTEVTLRSMQHGR